MAISTTAERNTPSLKSNVWSF